MARLYVRHGVVQGVREVDVLAAGLRLLVGLLLFLRLDPGVDRGDARISAADRAGAADPRVGVGLDPLVQAPSCLREPVRYPAMK